MKKILSLILPLLLLFSCDAVVEKEGEKEVSVKGASSGFNETWAKNFIDSINLQFSEHIRKGDSAAVASLYWADAELLLPNSAPVKGSEVATVFGSMIRMGVKEFTFQTTDLKGSEEYIIETGTYDMNDAANKNIDKGNYLVIWQNRNGQWKLYRDIGNSNLPAAH